MLMTETKLPLLKTELPGPKARQIVEQDHKFLSPSYTRSYPLVAKSGRGAIVEDVDGNSFLDFAACIAVVATGHCHPEVVAAIQKQAAELIHMSGTDFYYPNLVEFARRLGSIVPGAEPKRVFFTNSGTEAVEAAMKLARYHSGREKFIAFTGCFHGRTFGSLSLTASKSVQRKGFGMLVPGVFHAPYPNTYRGSWGFPPETVADDSINFIEHALFHRLVDPSEIAAVFIEPIQGEGGYLPAPARFLQKLQALCRHHGILLVLDEVQSGMGRTGKWWACEHSGIEPDIICIAKGIASGMPLGAMVARASVMDWKPGSHATTFGGNPVCIAAGLATMNVLEGGYIANAAKMGEFLFARMNGWPSRFRIVGDVRGKGLMIGIEFVRDQKTREKSPEIREKIIQAAFQRGLLVLGAGGNGVRLSPPLMIDEEQADCALRILESCIEEVERTTS
jgi:4-aminobutyrate aminotransferase